MIVKLKKTSVNGCFQDSSSSPSSPGDSVVPAVPPLPPGLPPEPPPGPPPPPTGNTNEDMTVVTTYTSFVPLPNTNMAPPPHHPMGYMNTDMHQMSAFNSWGMNPIGDMGGGMQHHMYPPPQMMNSYNSPPPQQHFPFLNQPPPSLPYQMQMPPPCHQHYRMPNQGPPPSINLISVRQEITNIKPNPVVITQVPDSNDTDYNFHSTTHLETSSKCKHNPLGQNNQTIQEAIDSVKKCLKNCDSIKNKDPRLANVEMRNKSPDRSEGNVTNSANGTLADLTVEVDDRDLESKSAQSNDLSTKIKPDNYNEKHCNIEGIVSKLKDTIGTTGNHIKKDETQSQILDSSKSFLISKYPDTMKATEVLKTGNEPYDPFNNCDETCVDNNKIDRADKSELEISKTVLNSETNLLGMPKLCQSEIYRINLEIHNTFSFILCHTIERKRLTPTLASIQAKKLENQNKSKHLRGDQPSESEEQEDKIQSSSPQPEIMSLNQPSAATTKDEEGECEIQHANVGRNDNEKTEMINKSLSPGTHLNLKTEEVCQIKPSDKPNHEELSSNEVLSQIGNPLGKNISSNDIISEVNTNVLEKTTGKEITLDGDTYVPSKHNIVDKCPSINTEVTMFSTNNTNEDKVIRSTNESEDDQTGQNNQSKCELFEQRQHIGSKNDISNASSKEIQKTNKIKEQIFELMAEEVPSKTKKVLPAVTTLSKIKEACCVEKRVHPLLSIPTKGELKRFPTSEQTLHQVGKISNLGKNDKVVSKSYSESNESEKKVSVHINPNTLNVPKGVVESILHDFDDSNSTGSDFSDSTKKKLKKEKLDVSVKKFLSDTSTKFQTEHKDLREKDFKNNTETSNPIYGLTFDREILEKQNDLRIGDKDNSDNDKDNSNESKITHNLTKEGNKIHKQEDDKTNASESNSKTTRDNKTERHKRNKTKTYAEHSFSKEDETKFESTKIPVICPSFQTKESKESTNYSKDMSQINIQEDINNLEIKVSDNIKDNKSTVINRQCKESFLSKPRPLSKKSKSYISQHLPTSFDLSSDAHLIRRGKKSSTIILL